MNISEKKYSADYWLGNCVGEIIEMKYLPTLDIDMLHTHNVIYVSQLEKETFELKENNWKYYAFKNKDEIKAKEAFEEMNAFRNQMARRYLLSKLECLVSRIEIGCVDDFKCGLNDYLWNTDLSWYCAEDDFLVTLEEFSWATKIVLTLKIQNEEHITT